MKEITKDINNIIHILVINSLVSVYEILTNNNKKIKIEQIIINFLFNFM